VSTRDVGLAASTGQEAVMTDAVEALRKNVEQEAADDRSVSHAPTGAASRWPSSRQRRRDRRRAEEAHAVPDRGIGRDGRRRCRHVAGTDTVSRHDYRVHHLRHHRRPSPAYKRSLLTAVGTTDCLLACFCSFSPFSFSSLHRRRVAEARVGGDAGLNGILISRLHQA
jgi:hypothetical protein